MAGIEKDQKAGLAATYNAIEELPLSVPYQEDVKRAPTTVQANWSSL